jgi:peptide/nickel transport system substrate-binding protein
VDRPAPVRPARVHRVPALIGRAAIAAAALLLPAGVLADASPPLRIALNSDIRGLEPGVNRDINTDVVIHHVVETLVAHRRDLSIGPALADRWTISDDGLIYRFELRRGVRFHNGAPVTSREVVWSWRRNLEPSTNWACRSWFDGSGGSGESGVQIERIDAPDDHTVVFRLTRPSGMFLTQLANVQCAAAVLHPDSVGPDGHWRGPVGTGPYRLSEWRRGEYVELVRFDGYLPRAEPRSGYAGARIARMERIRFVVVPEAVAAVAALRAGALDIVDKVSPDVVKELEDAPGIRLMHQPLLGWTVLLINTRDPLLSDLRFRQALAHVIQRDRIVQVNTGGLATVNSSAVPVGSAYRRPEHDAWYAYDLTRARELVAASGYRGQRVRIQTNRRYKNMFDNAVVIQAMLHSIGVRAELDVMDWASQLARYQSGRFQLSAFSYSARLDPALTYGNLIGDRSERGNVQWEDPGALELLARLAAATDPPERSAIMVSLHQRMVQQVPIIGLYNGHSTTAVASEIEGLETWGPGTLYLWGVSRRGGK